jgi:signal transduction histidine kinase
LKGERGFGGRARGAVVIGAAAAVTLAHYGTDPRHTLLHNLYQRLYYVPILLACAWFGLRGGLVAAVACAVLYAPHIVVHWAHDAAYQMSQALELAMFAVVALIAGALSDRERALRTEAEATAVERDRALRDLEETVGILRRADRLASLGTLAAGMAHEVRNPLGAIGGAVEILETDYPPTHPHREFVEILRKEIDRLKGIAGKYLNFARPDPPEPRPLDPNEAVRSAVDLLSKTAARASVRIELRLAPDLPPALADPGQVQQALVNLLLNGIQSMPGGGVLEVDTSLRSGAVEIALRDHGGGLPEGPVERIFEPFFSTQPGGTGLGLAISRRIAESHGGRLTAEPAEGGGARFRLALLPALRDLP